MASGGVPHCGWCPWMRMLLPRRASDEAQTRCLSLPGGHCQEPMCLSTHFISVQISLFPAAPRFKSCCIVGCPYQVQQRRKGKCAL